MPAEWEPHEATWLAWPQTIEYWPDMDSMESIYKRMVFELTQGENVNILVNTETKKRDLGQEFKEAGFKMNKILFHLIPTKDIWIRDYGPTFLIEETYRQLIACRWKFNAWGEKYDMPDEPLVSKKIQQNLGIDDLTPNIIMEGGAIEVNGEGTCLTTEECLLNLNRNPGKVKVSLENYFKEFLKIRQTIWLCGHLEGDDTDGHIDNLARFVNKNTILCAWETNPNDPNYEGLKQNYELLTRTKNIQGKPFNVVKFPMPEPVTEDSRRLPASYANFYIGNSALLVPTYDQPTDDAVINIIEKLFPDRRVVAIPSTILITGNGGPHCATQQQPRI